jgi:hypothetical protein
MLLFVGVGIFLFIHHHKPSIQKRARRARAINSDDFLEQWDAYRRLDRPGCYIITIYNRRPKKRKVKRLIGYHEIYVGQSVNMYRRVFNHFTGHGNGDVYADVKYQRHVFVKFIPCSPEQLNNYEKCLISQYNTTTSYNRTKGGAKLTKKQITPRS